MKKLSHSIRMIALTACASLLFGTAACAKKQSSPFNEKSTFASDSTSGDRELNMTVDVVSGRTIHYEITAKDNDKYMFGNLYTLEYKSGDDWYVVPFLADHMFTMEGYILDNEFISDDGNSIHYYDGDEEIDIPYQNEEEAERIVESVREYLESSREPAENGRVVASDDIDLSEMCGDDLPSGHYRLIKDISLLSGEALDHSEDFCVVAEFDL
ncbi:MAG: hypothetical protein J5653_09540 [Clostridiales bacterium]|nr:hypothetical protein [Clostridiales bacterium]